MAINNVKDTQSLLVDIEDWMNNPKFQPQEQNKWFFGDGLSYYTQLCEVVKVLTYLQENFKVVIANEKSLEQAYNEVKDLPSQFTVLSNRVDELSNTVNDLPTRVQELETKVTKLISDVSSQLTRIETLESSVVSINAKDISQDDEIASIKNKNQEQDTLIDSNTNKITTLEGKDFLQQVAFNNSATITFIDEGKSEGTQTFSANVTGSTPANLTSNLAYLNNNPNSNIVSNVVLTWNVNENKCYLKKDMSYYSNGNINTVTSRLELDSAWFTINENTLTLKASVLDNYLTKDDAPGYADILTKTLANTTYVSKTESVGYDDILTNANASTTYETKANATATYETKANASSTYVSKAEAVGYDDILTNANANTTYETKANASATYVSQNSLIDKIYPVGSIYLSVSNINPNILFNGTVWEQIKDKFLLGSGDLYSNGTEGGEANHTLSIEEMPIHNHFYNSLQYGYPENTASSEKYTTPIRLNQATDLDENRPNTNSNFTGGGQPHNNMPPYLSVNMWKRVS